jgi:hypothetical protein
MRDEMNQPLGGELQPLFGDDEFCLPHLPLSPPPHFSNSPPSRTTSLTRGSFPVPDVEDVERLMQEGKLVFKEDNKRVDIYHLYDLIPRDERDPRAIDVVEYIKRKEKPIFVVDTSSNKYENVWPPFLNRDIYKDFEPGLDIEEFKKDIEFERGGDGFTLPEQKYFEHLKSGEPLDCVPRSLHRFMKGRHFIRKWNPHLS